jgi:SAM-dependent methyltransferase
MPRPCPICAADNSRRPAHHYSQPPWELKQCAQCGLVYLENPPAALQLETDFAWDKTWSEEHARRRRREPFLYYTGRALQSIPKKLFQRDKLIASIRRFVVPGPILDVGCASGHTLLKLPDAYIPYGLDVTHEAAIAHQRFSTRGGQAIQGDAISVLRNFPENLFSGVLMSSYLEHETDPRSALELATRVLRPGGRLILKVPNYACWNRTVRGARWCGFRYPDHVNYFNPALLLRLVQSSGLRIARSSFLDHLPTSDNMWLIAEKPSL